MISKNKNTGFTLIETLVAILVLTMSIAGPLTIASKGLSTALIAKDKTIATFLAQDAVEFIRYQRDTNRLNSQPWLQGLSSCISADGSKQCAVLSISGTINGCAGTCPVLNYDAASNTYLYSGGVPTIYTRSVSILTPVCSTAGVCNADEAKVTVNVTWRDVGTQMHTMSVVEHLLDWQ